MIRSIISVLLVFAFLFSVSIGLAQDCFNFTPGMQPLGSCAVPDAIRAAVQSDFICVGIGTGSLVVIDKSDPTSPQSIAELSLGSPLTDLVWVGDLAYVTTYAGLKVVDLSVPSSPVLLGSLDLSGYPRDLAVIGDNAFIAGGAEDVIVVDLSDPASPVLSGSFNWQGTITTLAAANGFLLAGGTISYDLNYSDSRILTLDLTQPSTPLQVAAYELGGSSPADFFFMDDHLYLQTTITYRSGPYAWDPSLHTTSVTRLHLDTGGELSFVAAHGYARSNVLEFVGLSGFENRVVVGLRNGTMILDADTMQPLGEIPSACAAPASDGNQIILPYADEIVIYDGSEIGEYAVVDSAPVAIVQTDAFLTATDNLLYRLGDEPAQGSRPGDSPYTLVTGYSLTGQAIDHAVWGIGAATMWESIPTTVEAYGDYLFVTRDDLEVYEIPSTTAVGDPIHEYYDNLVAGGGLLAAARWGSDPLDVYDITTPSTPVLIHTIPQAAGSRLMSTRDANIYCASATLLRVHDVSGPDPIAVDFDLLSPIKDFELEGPIGCALVDAGTGDQLHIISLSEPLEPELLASIALPGECQDLEVRNGIAYLGSTRLGVVAVDVTSPVEPEVLGSYFMGSVFAITTNSNALFVATHDGTHSLAFSCEGAVATTLAGFSATAAAAQVDVRWQTLGASESMDFRLDASCDDATWTVPFSGQRTEFVAVDEQAYSYAPGQITYMLSIREEGHWLEMASQSIELQAPLRAAAIHDAWPNPFNPSITIAYETERPGRVTVEVFDVAGRRVTTLVNENAEAGTYQTIWNGRNGQGHTVPAGTYFAHLVTETGVRTQKMQLLK